jgi:hypothetical protein
MGKNITASEEKKIIHIENKKEQVKQNKIN